MGQAAAAAHGIDGLDVIEIVMQYGLCRFATANAADEQLRTVMVLHRRGERATVRLADAEQVVADDAMAWEPIEAAAAAILINTTTH